MMYLVYKNYLLSNLCESESHKIFISIILVTRFSNHFRNILYVNTNIKFYGNLIIRDVIRSY